MKFQNEYWQLFGPNFRQIEVRDIADWINRWESGSVIALPGMGRASFLDYLANHPTALANHLRPDHDEVICVSLDINQLPDLQLATFYRILLRAIYEKLEEFNQSLRDIITELYRKCEASQDPFLSQSALRELLQRIRLMQVRLVFIFNRFDDFCRNATQEMLATLLDLRDSFRNTVIYIVGVSRELHFLTALDQKHPLYQVIDTHHCYLGPLTSADCRNMISTRLSHASAQLQHDAQHQLGPLTGCISALNRVCCQLLDQFPELLTSPDLTSVLLAHDAVQFRISRIWNALTSTEQYALIARHEEPISNNLSDSQIDVLSQLGIWNANEKDLNGSIMQAFADKQAKTETGMLRIDESTDLIMRGRHPITAMSPLEEGVLRFLLQRPQKRCSYSEIILAVWDVDDSGRKGVTDQALHQVARRVRLHIETDPSQPRYLVNYRGKPEGGYQLFPEGQPNAPQVE